MKLNINDVKVISVPIPAKYGNEKSTIRYTSFIVKFIPFFIKSLIWRLSYKAIFRRKSDEYISNTIDNNDRGKI